MTSIFDYIKKYGDKTFIEKDFNEVDAAIMSLLTYVDFNNIVLDKKKSVKLGNCLEYFLLYYDMKSFMKNGFLQKELVKLCKALKDKERYKNIALYNYIYKIGFDEQFGALMMKLPTGITIVAFEGTDSKLTGWEEDMALTYKFPVPAQKDAINYINKNVSLFDKEVIVLGHSKGGHLAIVASMFANPLVKLKIKKVYNFDGPGLRKKEILSNKYKNVEKKLNYIIPEYSLFGLMLRHGDNYSVVNTNKRGLNAHSIFTWIVDDDQFKKGKLRKLSSNLDKSIIIWLDKHNDEEKEKITKNIFNYLRNLGIITTKDIIKFKNIISIIKNNKEMDKETKQVLVDFIKFNVEYHMNSDK